MSAILLLLPRADAQQKIAERIDSGQALLNEPIQGEADLTRLRRDRDRWHSYNLELLRRMFDTDGPLTEYNPKRGGIIFAPETLYQQIESFHRSVETNLNRLRSIVEKLELYEEASSVTPTPAAESDSPSGRDVFIVHGHAGREYEVAHVVHDMGLKSVILKEEINRGSPTLIEKLEREAKRSGYAIVIFTPDDLGRSVKEKDEKPRTRQNVILELGFFIAKLGRDKVTILHDPTVEVPSDFGGVTYYPLDEAGGWKSRIQAELEAADLT
jgi:predicted nucleotide-binding protein